VADPAPAVAPRTTRMTGPTPSFSEEQRSDPLFQAMIHTLELLGVYLGKRLGLYRLGV
jgi:hypothetical protein